VPNGRRLSLVLLAIAAAVGFCRAGFRDQYELGRLTYEFNRRMVTGDTRGIYRLFNESFRDENSYARFDSAVQHWLGERRFARAGRKIVDIRPPSAAVSVYYVFEGERDYRYLYQNWIYNGRSWKLAWVSRILDRSFQYGQSDTAELRNAAEAALRWLVSPEGLKVFRTPLVRPAVLVLVRKGLPGEGEYRVPGSEVAWVSETQARDPQQLPPVPHIYTLALARLMGDVAQVTFDLRPANRKSPGRLGRERSVEIFLIRDRNGWKFANRGRVW
jgi:hypothetical protein